MENPKMIACPCGGQPELIEENTDMNLSLKGVRCKKCGEAIPLIHDHAPEAIRAWNDWAGGRQPEPSKTGGTKGVGISDLLAAAGQQIHITGRIFNPTLPRGSQWQDVELVVHSPPEKSNK